MKPLSDPVGRDLIYDRGAVSGIRNRWPGVVINDASDEIHDERVEVVLPATVSVREWFLWLLETGWHSVSLMFGVAMGQPRDSEFGRFIDKWIADRSRKRSAR